MEEASGFRISSFGYVAENKALGSKIILVTPIEDLPLLDGDLKSNSQTKEATGKDASGVSYSLKVDVDNVVEAEWLPLGSNRKTAPDVRRGVRVVIWKYGDSDKYYWTTTGQDDHLFKLETVLYCWSGTKDESATEQTPDNSYFAEVSTHKKTITVKTSKANGEAFSYTIQVNAADSAVIVTDDAGNYFELDSEERKLTLKNSDDTSVILDKRDLLFNAPDNLIAEAGQSIVFRCGASCLTLTPGETSLITPKFRGDK